MSKLSRRANAGLTAVTAFAAASALLLCPVHGWAGSHKNSKAPEPPPVRATVQPAHTIPTEALEFSPPAPFYLGTRNSLVSLDFLDEDELLFTFRVPGLIHRDHSDLAAGNTGEERQVRAMVLHLPDGAVKAEAVWTLHDRRRYLSGRSITANSCCATGTT